MSIDFYIFHLLNQFAGRFSWLDNLAVFFGNNYFAYVLAFILFLAIVTNYKKYRWVVAEAIIAGIFARFVITEIIRFFWHRSRPFIDHNVNVLFTHDNEGSFPSGHAAFFIAMSAVLYTYNRKLGILFFISGLLIGFARAFSGIHWPFDIVGGALVGILSGWLVIKLSRKLHLG